MALHRPNPFTWWLRKVIIRWFARPLTWMIWGPAKMGVSLPESGPAILAPNHNSHLDTLFLLCALSRSGLKRLRPVAAADYFLRNRVLAWFTLNVVGIIPIARSGSNDPLADCRQALEEGWILLFFPEGTRGEPEVRAKAKSGLKRLVEAYSSTQVYPVFIQGAGKSLPKGEKLPVPFRPQVVTGEPLDHNPIEDFLERYEKAMIDLRASCIIPEWE